MALLSARRYGLKSALELLLRPLGAGYIFVAAAYRRLTGSHP